MVAGGYHSPARGGVGGGLGRMVSCQKRRSKPDSRFWTSAACLADQQTFSSRKPTRYLVVRKKGHKEMIIQITSKH